MKAKTTTTKTTLPGVRKKASPGSADGSMELKQYTLVELHNDSSAETILQERRLASEKAGAIPAPLFVP